MLLSMFFVPGHLSHSSNDHIQRVGDHRERDLVEPGRSTGLRSRVRLHPGRLLLLPVGGAPLLEQERLHLPRPRPGSSWARLLVRALGCRAGQRWQRLLLAGICRRSSLCSFGGALRPSS